MKSCLMENSMRKPLWSVKNVLATIGAVFAGYAGYVFLASLPDLKRYIRISTM